METGQQAMRSPNVVRRIKYLSGTEQQSNIRKEDSANSYTLSQNVWKRMYQRCYNKINACSGERMLRSYAEQEPMETVRAAKERFFELEKECKDS